MRCTRPLDGWYAQKVNASGKRSVVFDMRAGLIDRPVSLPCGQCIGCRLERSRETAVRCVCEASLYSENCFVTLTYAPDCLPAGASLVKADVQGFMKRLRARYAARRIRFLLCGEYGEQFGRPHYHVLLFGFDFSDKFPSRRSGETVMYRSASLESVWPFGRSEIGSVTFESAAYVARYVTKKITGESAEAHYGARIAEFSTRSLRPGIGAEWFERNRDFIRVHDGVVSRGRLVKPPRSFDVLMERADPVAFAKLKAQRAASRPEDDPDDRSSRLEVIDDVLMSRLAFFDRRELS